VSAPNRKVFDEVKGLATEQRNPRTMELDRLPTRAVLERINDEDRTVADVVRGEIPHIEQAVELAYAAISAGGRKTSRWVTGECFSSETQPAE